MNLTYEGPFRIYYNAANQLPLVCSLDNGQERTWELCVERVLCDVPLVSCFTPEELQPRFWQEGHGRIEIVGRAARITKPMEAKDGEP